MTLEKNFGAALLDATRIHADRNAYTAPDGNLTYKTFGQFIAVLVQLLRHNGVGRGSCVAIAIGDPRASIGAIAACSLIGAAWIDGTSAPGKREYSGITHSLIDSRFAPPRPLPGRRIVLDMRAANPSKAIAELRASPPQGFANDTDLCFVGSSSGTTGEKKLIHISAIDAWYRTTMFTTGNWAGHKGFSSLCLFPPLSGLGSNTRINTLLFGGTNVEGISLEQLKDARIDQVMASPVQYVKYMEMFPSESISKKLPMAKTGGSQTGESLLRALGKYFEKIVIQYGAVETGKSAECLDVAADSYDGHLNVMPELAEFQIVDEDDRPVAFGTVGRVRVRSTHGAPAFYLDDDAANASAFKDGWFYSGDLGSLTEDGKLYLQGRDSETVNLGGVKVNLLRIDEFVQSYPGITDGFAFVAPGKLGVGQVQLVISIQPGHDPSEVATALLRDIRTQPWSSTSLMGVHIVANVPRNDMGKPMRKMAAELAGKAAQVSAPETSVH